jgi:hypothetical protein
VFTRPAEYPPVTRGVSPATVTQLHLLTVPLCGGFQLAVSDAALAAATAERLKTAETRVKVSRTLDASC